MGLIKKTMRIPRKLSRLVAPIILLVVTVLGIVGCHTMTDSETGYSPSLLTYNQAMAAALIAQNEYPGCLLLRSVGTSMLPKYGNNTIYVIKPIAWDALKPGMDVAYKRPTGETVVHRLIATGGNFWIVQGINNSVPDVYHVTPGNLIGQVWTAFSYERPEDSAPP